MNRFLGNMLGRAFASAVDSVLHDVGKEVKKVNRKIKRTRIHINNIKENSYGCSETETED